MKPKVIGIGELLWDHLPTGPRMGGAPANFTCHTRALGAQSTVISRVGTGEWGDALLARLSELGVGTEGVSRDPEHPTGRVDVELAADGQPKFTILRGMAWDHLEATETMLELVSSADAVCFGTLGQRSLSSRSAIRQLVASTPAHALRVFDVNLREDYYSAEVLDESLRIANVCKLSDAELPIVSKLLGLDGASGDRLEELRARYQLRLVAYTRGAEGSVLAGDGCASVHPGLPTRVRDTIGAGDSFTAAVTMGMLHGWSLDEISETANETAAFVCSHEGAVPMLPASIRRRFDPPLPRPAASAESSLS